MSKDATEVAFVSTQSGYMILEQLDVDGSFYLSVFDSREDEQIHNIEVRPEQIRILADLVTRYEKAQAEEEDNWFDHGGEIAAANRG